MVLVVQIDIFLFLQSGKVYFAILCLKCLQNMTIGQYNVATNVIKCQTNTFCGPLLGYGCHGYHHMTKLDGSAYAGKGLVYGHQIINRYLCKG